MFKTKAGLELPGISSNDLQKIRTALLEEIGLTYPQLTEAASYSMAMVVRFALGLSAAGGKVACIFDDTLTGWIALATTRHLMNAGSNAELIFIGDAEHPSPDLELQIAPFNAVGQSLTVWTSPDQNSAIASILETCHNSLCGYYKLGVAVTPFEQQINEMLNELTTPIYTIEAPPGIDADTGKSQGSPLYASCTLSLGAPLIGLAGSDYVGRHYVCDLSIPPGLYRTAGMDLSPIFADQPVQQIFANQAEESN